jgi:hypothetical protein
MVHSIFSFRVKDKAELYEMLEVAVAAAQDDAFASRKHGILVTRHDFGHFSVALSTNVPFGLIREDDQAKRK